MYNNYWNQNPVPVVGTNYNLYQNPVSSVNSDYQYYQNDMSTVEQDYHLYLNPGTKYKDERSTRREIQLSPGSASQTDLGNGFISFRWAGYDINTDEYLVAFLNAPGMKVINGGWAPKDYAPLYAMESFPRRIDQWVITTFNPTPGTGSPRPIEFYLIAKA
ncbi:hypothetical protein CON01_22290 [Bacillus thuringiensis]|uniref:Uncharacterized protein n=2 Tax=Bacillus TaxID=1386 RepID=A0A9X6TXB8_BACTU|nr:MULTISPECIES: hypothetical protein [Bacillus cereus group]MCC2385426.1 hypothetical protein [Bacillus cereus]MCU5276584.1 hypothetical protein [Bacillus cereus]MCU5757889.1 hypothetical protein [Bacillus cereus]PED12307.1 hypothetical protein CON01_22290 [Bacillus thuringiensis]PEF13059.1 hypothetical protein CON23_07880 [Bacillus thuringiensis]